MKKEVSHILSGSVSLTQNFLKNGPEIGELIVFSNGSTGIIIHVRILRGDGNIIMALAFGRKVRLDMSVNWYWHPDEYWYENKNGNL